MRTALGKTLFQTCLKHVKLLQSTSLNNPDQLVELLGSFHEKPCFLASLEVKNIYESIQKDMLFLRLRELVETDIVSFQSYSGCSVDRFMEFLRLYLLSNVIKHEVYLFKQIYGICIGSWVAPAVNEVVLYYMNCSVVQFLESCGQDLLSIVTFVDAPS